MDEKNSMPLILIGLVAIVAIVSVAAIVFRGGNTNAVPVSYQSANAGSADAGNLAGDAKLVGAGDLTRSPTLIQQCTPETHECYVGNSYSVTCNLESQECSYDFGNGVVTYRDCSFIVEEESTDENLIGTGFESCPNSPLTNISCPYTFDDSELLCKYSTAVADCMNEVEEAHAGQRVLWGGCHYPDGDSDLNPTPTNSGSIGSAHLICEYSVCGDPTS